MLIRQVGLLTDQLEELHRFYSITLGLPVIEDNHDHITIQIGSSLLSFGRNENKDERPFYHYAIDIPNKLEESMKWLDHRGIMLNELPGGKYQTYSERWNSTSIYFYDPAGNIVEFVARHNMNNDTPGEFHAADFLRINEIGLVAPDVPSLRETLKSKFSLNGYQEYDRFSAVGREEGLFVLTADQRVWLGSDKPAEIHRTDVVIENSVEGDLDLPKLPYTIRSERPS